MLMARFISIDLSEFAVPALILLLVIGPGIVIITFVRRAIVAIPLIMGLLVLGAAAFVAYYEFFGPREIVVTSVSTRFSSANAEITMDFVSQRTRVFGREVARNIVIYRHESTNLAFGFVSPDASEPWEDGRILLVAVDEKWDRTETKAPIFEEIWSLRKYGEENDEYHSNLGHPGVPDLHEYLKALVPDDTDPLRQFLDPVFDWPRL